MQHNRAGRKLGRTTAHRKALFRNQLSSLITHERIQTTLPKAKDLRPLIEKMVTLGKRGGLHARRLVLKTIPEAPTVKKLFEEIAPRFQSSGKSASFANAIAASSILRRSASVVSGVKLRSRTPFAG